MKRLLTTTAVAAVLVGGAILPGTAAHAAGPNYLARDCAKVTTSCVVEPPTVDALLRSRSITVHDGTGRAITIRTRSQLNRVLIPHAKKCVVKGDLMGCWFTDQIMGRSIVFPHGMTVAARFLR